MSSGPVDFVMRGTAYGAWGFILGTALNKFMDALEKRGGSRRVLLAVHIALAAYVLYLHERFAPIFTGEFQSTEPGLLFPGTFFGTQTRLYTWT